MFRQIALAVIAACGLLAGCATPYGPNAGFGGVNSKMIGPAEAVIVVATNAMTGSARAQQLLLLGSADLTSAAGKRRFSLVSIEDPKALEAQKASRLGAYARQAAAGVSGEASLRSERTSYSINRAPVTHTRYGGVYFVVMYDDARGAYDAGEIRKRLGGKL